MKSFFSIVPPVCMVLLSGCSQGGDPVVVEPSSQHIFYMGRMDWTDPAEPAFTYPGTTAMLSFESPWIDMAVSPGSGHFVVEIDSMPAQKVFFGERDSVMRLADNLGDGIHNARITYCIEGYEKNPHWRGFMLAPGGQLHEPKRPKGPKIEFIGNSIICGYGTDAEGPEIHFSYETENHCLTFAHLAARLLDAEYYVVARSGAGIYRNYNGPREGSPDGRMPDDYDNVLIYHPENKWDFSKWQPDIVCVNLGTNDLSLNNYDIDLFRDAAGRFTDHIREVYPEATIVLLTGPMLHGKTLEDARGALDAVAAEREGVERFDLSEETGELGYGAEHHPSAKRHAVNAVELSQFIMHNS